MKYDFEIKKQIGEKGYYFSMSAYLKESENGEIGFSNDSHSKYMTYVQFAYDIFFEKFYSIDNKCTVIVHEFDVIPYDTSILTIVYGMVKVLCDFYKKDIDDIIMINKDGDFIFI